MPAYGSVSPPLMSAGYGSAVWNNENVTAGSCSQAVCMHRNPNLPNCISVQLKFATDPGAFSIGLEVADTDQDAYYVSKATLTTGLNPSFVGRIEATNIVAKFLRLRLNTLTNAVKITATIY